MTTSISSWDFCSDWIESLKEVKIPIPSPSTANFMYIFSGIAVFTFTGEDYKHDVDSDGWIRKTLRIDNIKTFPCNVEIIHFSANGSLNSFSNSGSDTPGWALDKIEASFHDEYPPEGTNPQVCKSRKIYANADLALSNKDVSIYRTSFQVIALVKE